MQTIGERLEEARKKKGISIREAAEATKIRGDYLQKFESNHFDIGLTEIYTRGFLRTYANFLKLPADRILSDYAALGRGDVRPRQPSREIYGRMDISVATAEAGDAPGTKEDVATPEPSHANRGPGRPRTGSSLPTGPDPAVVFKYLKWGGGAIILLLLVLIVKSLVFNGAPSSANANPTATPTTPRTPVLTLIPVGPVQAKVMRVNADRTDGELLYAGVLNAGANKTVARPGPLFLEAIPPENMDFEIDGKRMNLAKVLAPFGPGYVKGELPGPTP